MESIRSVNDQLKNSSSLAQAGWAGVVVFVLLVFLNVMQGESIVQASVGAAIIAVVIVVFYYAGMKVRSD